MANKLIDLTNKVFHRLTVIGISHKSKSGTHWLCQCECGNTKAISSGGLRSGASKSCGCWNREVASNRMSNYSRTHGMASGEGVKKGYSSWHAMKERCDNPNHEAYARYGGRGIKICEEWRYSFETFYRDMGERPLGTSLDRIENDKGYYKENCRWSTPKEQNNNRRSTKLIPYRGKIQSVTKWVEELNISRYIIDTKIKQGLSLGEIVKEMEGTI